MGNNSSKTKTSQSITNTTINQDLLYDVNQTMMNVSTSTLVNDAKECSSSVSNNNTCQTKFGDITGDYISNADQSNIAKTDFSCVTSSKATNDMNSSMVQSLISQMKSLNGTDNAASLNSAANAASNNGSLSTGTSSSSSATDSKISNNVTNETITYIENIFEQNLNNNFSSETVDKCIGKTTQTNTKTDEAGNVIGDVNIGCTQTNSSEQIQKCTLLSEAINKTLTQTASELGLTIVSESNTKTTSESTTTASAEATSTGIIQDTGTAISGIIDSIGGILTGLGTEWIISIVACVCVVLIVIIGIIAFSNTKGGEQAIGAAAAYANKSGGYFSNSSSSSFSLGSSSTSFGLGSSSTDSYFTYHGVNLNENGGIFSDTTITDIIMTPNVLLTL